IWSELETADRELVAAAQEAAARAYAPYSLFAVGAAVRSLSGKIYTGANLENASFGLTVCAEAAALSAANTSGDFAVEAIAVLGISLNDPADTSGLITPCGSCRQIIAEAGLVTGNDVRVLCCDPELSGIVVSTITELLPNAFGAERLGRAEHWRSLRGELQGRIDRLITLKKQR
ncbi:MAG TPA: cytidine deaminase, partial [Stellaceae bacterium]|nr:cytidine deaminase [Stellaceae bacterium]